MSDINIIAIHKVKPEFVNEYHQAAKIVLTKSRQESGCVKYEVNVDINNPNTFIFTETWATKQAIEYHKQTAHFLEFIAFLDNKLVERNFYITNKL
ncbi:putative quinol monooxygenase [Gilliamella sp. wkB112]|uniref:putative quinol monooxygenase n=1 Tax=Gilliamella sp. wkB112 TaxID=3120257 RepID=UPI00080EE3A4|nr:putative quinol monooxygenase [Gilliamella apicola]OCG01673.1 hypothetical protein A9G12_11870 [Gilliamella apicola]